MPDEYGAYAPVIVIDPETRKAIPRTLLSGMINRATIIETGSRRIRGISVIVSGSGVGFLCDTADLNKLAGNEVVAVPNMVGFSPLDIPVARGIGISPSPGMTLRVLFE